MADEQERLIATLSDRYAIQRELGRGGMECRVALKVLKPELAAVLGGVVMVAALGAGCGDTLPPLDDEPRAPSELIAVSGGGQVGGCFTELPRPVVVRVRDDRSAAMPGQTVDFRVVQGRGSVREGTTVSDSHGLAADYWTLGAPGLQRLEARLAAAIGESGEPVVDFSASAEEREVGLRRVTTLSPIDNPMPPAISGDYIAWVDRRNGRRDIYLYDLATETERRITTDMAFVTWPAIAGDRIVWIGRRQDDYAIYAYDLATESERRVTTDEGSPELNSRGPAISGDRIVWTDSRNGNPDIYMFDLVTETERRITTDTSRQMSPAISGDRIVWLDFRSGNWDVYLHDLATDTERAITNDSPWQSSPSVSGDRIVWADARNGNLSVYVHDLAAERERLISTGGSPAVDHDRVVWVEDFDVRLYDLATGTERRFTNDPVDQAYPAVSGDRIVWVTNQSPSVYLYDLADACVPPAQAGELVSRR